jgi:hypothetical protein
MAETTEQHGGIRIIDPNPEGTNVAHEDLSVYVKLLAKTKSRSILEREQEITYVIEQELSNVANGPTNYTYPGPTGPNAKDLTTEWTNIGGGKLQGGKDVGTFGISSIDIDIKSSFQPQVTVNFIDVRGATLFEQGPCSPYASFFHMPYPVFELTVKGFYGKPVTYILALRQFNTKFNSATGNFEVKADFIGYTYAFLADVVMGYAFAASSMVGGEEKLQNIWDKMLATNYPPDAPLENKMTEKAISIKKMITDISSLETILGELENSDKFLQTSQLNALKQSVQQQNGALKEFKESFMELPIGPSALDSDIQGKGKLFLRTPSTKSSFTGTTNTQIKAPESATTLVKNYFGDPNAPRTDRGSYENSINNINENFADIISNFPELSPIKAVKDIIVHRGLSPHKEDPKKNRKFKDGRSYYYIDIGAFKHENDKFIETIDITIKDHQETLTNIINATVKDQLGFVPTIRNVSIILLSNMECFLHLLIDSSRKAQEYHEEFSQISSLTTPPSLVGMSGTQGVVGDGKTEKVYAWPLYYEKKDNEAGASTSVETYPGENSEFVEWKEVEFVEDFLVAYLDVLEEIDIITGDVSDIPGFMNYIPMNPFESSLFDTVGGRKPNAYFKDGAQSKDALPTVFRNAGQRAFLVGDYTMVNPLVLWKTRVNFNNDKYTGGSRVPTPLNTIVNSNLTTENISPSPNDDEHSKKDITTLMRLYGRLDGMNAANTIEAKKTLEQLQNQLNKSTAKEDVKKQILEALGTEFTNTPYTTFINNNNESVPVSLINKKMTYLQKNLTSPVYSYSGSIPIGGREEDANVYIKPNPHDPSNQTFVLLNLTGGDSIREIQIGADNVILEEVDNRNGLMGAKGWRNFLGDEEKKLIDTEGDNDGALTLDPATRIPSADDETVTNTINGSPGDKNTTERFLHLGPFADDSGINDQINYDFMDIQYVENASFNEMTTMDYGQPWNTSSTEDVLITTPLWAKNLYNQIAYRRPYGKPGNGGYNQTDQFGAQPKKSTSQKALAYLTLITMSKSEVSFDDNGYGFAGWYDDMGEHTLGGTDGTDGASNVKSITPFFRRSGSQVKVPKGFTYLTGAVLWRLRESGYLKESNPNTNNPGYTLPPGFEGLPPEGPNGNGGSYPWGQDPIYWPDETNSYSAGPSFTGKLQQQTKSYSTDIDSSNFGDDPTTGTFTTTTKTPHLGNGGKGGKANEPGMKKLEPYHWPHTYQSNDKGDNSTRFIFAKKGSTWEYIDIFKVMKTLLYLPNDIKKRLISEFENWATGTFATTYLNVLDPLHALDGIGLTPDIFTYYGLEDNRLGPKNGLGTGKDENPWTQNLGLGSLTGPEVDDLNKAVQSMHTELTQEHHIWGSATPKSFSGIYKTDMDSTSFNIREDEFDNFVDGWILGAKQALGKKLQDIQTNANGNESTRESALNDNDVKLSLYKSFKSIFDKWISRSDSDGESFELFYNKVRNEKTKDRLLIDHFQFVDRAFNDVGNKAVVDITQLLSLAENPTSSLYQTMTTLLSKNNFDFHPLPNFIEYGKENNLKEISKMFEPVTDLNDMNSSPSFVCMYVGGTSTNLDIGPLGSASCSNNKIEYKYENDGFKFSTPTRTTNIPDDITAGGSGVTAFLVEYGVENQSHFKTISLNQAEFKETQESLMVIDQLAKGGDSANRSSKGQNLYNVYQTRSYTCEVECMGNIMIQPMMYFQLENVPMFWGAYLITDVKHNIKPHYVTTTFTGVRVPKIVIPLVTDAMSSMTLGQGDTKKNGGSTDDILRNNNISVGNADLDDAKYNVDPNPTVTGGDFDKDNDGVADGQKTAFDTTGPTPNADTLRKQLKLLGYKEKGTELANGGDITRDMAQYAISFFTQLKVSYPNMSVVVTGGNDAFHQKLNYNSRHKSGKGLDFVIAPNSQADINGVDKLLRGFAGGDSYPYARFINEYDNPTRKASGKHFHISWGKGTEAQSTIDSALAQVKDGEIPPYNIA